MKLSMLAAGVLLADLAAQGASAGTIQLNLGNYRSGVGGQFQAVSISGDNGVIDTVSPPSFQTFCMEYLETFSPGNIYTTVINNRAIQGGVGLLGDPLDIRTAWLYTHFRAGDLNLQPGAGGYSPTSNASAGNLQDAIWWIEEEVDSNGNRVGANNFLVAAADNAVLNGWNTIGRVRVLNLYGSDGSNHQDQLTVIPLPPAAWAGAVGLAGVMALGYVRRRTLTKA
jgi:hypothetical protein